MNRILSKGEVSLVWVSGKDEVTKRIYNHLDTLIEADCMCRLEHPHIMHAKSCHMSTHDMDLVMPMALMDLGAHMKPIPLHYLHEIASAILYLHKNSIIHMDIKIHNILLMPDGHVVLTDFGLSRRIQCNRMLTDDGDLQSIPYAAPEGSLMHPDDGFLDMEITTAMDVWSFGCLAYAMMTGTNLFKIWKHGDRRKDSMIAEMRVALDIIDDADARQLIEKCLQMNPNDRITMHDIFDTIYFKRMGWSTPIQGSLLLDHIHSKMPIPDAYNNMMLYMLTHDTFINKSYVDAIMRRAYGAAKHMTVVEYVLSCIYIACFLQHECPKGYKDHLFSIYIVLDECKGIFYP